MNHRETNGRINHKGHEGHKGGNLQVLTIVSLVSLVVNLAGQSVTVRNIDKGARSQIDTPRQVVVDARHLSRPPDEGDDRERSVGLDMQCVAAVIVGRWEALWRQHMPDRSRAPVDFSNEMVVGVFLGSRPTAGHGVTIASVSEEGGVLHVRYRESQPPPGAISAQVITFPYHLVAVSKSNASNVQFEKLAADTGRRVTIERPAQVAKGAWNGVHVHVDVTDRGADIEFDCAHGRITQPLVLNERGEFDLPGTFTTEHGGPVRSTESPAAADARYIGRQSGTTLELKVLRAGETVGTFTLTQNGESRLTKCR